jgi:hypothetical protein
MLEPEEETQGSSESRAKVKRKSSGAAGLPQAISTTRGQRPCRAIEPADEQGDTVKEALNGVWKRRGVPKWDSTRSGKRKGKG